MLSSPPRFWLTAAAVVGAAAAAVVGLAAAVGAPAAAVGAAAGGVVGFGAAAGAVVGAGAAAGVLQAAVRPTPNTPIPSTRRTQRRVTFVGCTGSLTRSTTQLLSCV